MARPARNRTVVVREHADRVVVEDYLLANRSSRRATGRAGRGAGGGGHDPAISEAGRLVALIPKPRHPHRARDAAAGGVARYASVFDGSGVDGVSRAGARGATARLVSPRRRRRPSPRDVPAHHWTGEPRADSRTRGAAVFTGPFGAAERSAVGAAGRPGPDQSAASRRRPPGFAVLPRILRAGAAEVDEVRLGFPERCSRRTEAKACEQTAE